MQREAVLSQGTLSLQQPASFFQGTLHNLQIGLALVPKKKGIFSLGKVSAKVGYLLWIMWLAGSDPPAVQNERGLPQPQKKSRRVHVPKCLYMYKHIYIQTYILHIITYSGPKVYLCCDMLRLHVRACSLRLELLSLLLLANSRSIFGAGGAQSDLAVSKRSLWQFTRVCHKDASAMYPHRNIRDLANCPSAKIGYPGSC